MLSQAIVSRVKLRVKANWDRYKSIKCVRHAKATKGYKIHCMCLGCWAKAHHG